MNKWRDFQMERSLSVIIGTILFLFFLFFFFLLSFQSVPGYKLKKKSTSALAKLQTSTTFVGAKMTSVLQLLTLKINK